MSDTTTTYENMCHILSDFKHHYSQHPEFENFMFFHDIGLPLAFLLSEGIVESTERAEFFVRETFKALMLGLDIEDTGFESLDDVVIAAGLA